jgi:zinc protease
MTPPVHIERSTSTPLCSFTAAVKTGAVIDPEGREGSTRHMAELARRGAGSRERAAMDQAIDRLGATLDIDVDRDWVALSGSCLARNLDQTVALAADILRAPLMSQHEHEVLQRETIHELDDVRDDDGSLAERHFQRFCAPGHSYGRTTIGTEASIARLTAGDAARQHLAMWGQDHLVVGVAGPFDEARARQVAATLVGALDGRPGSPPPELSTPPCPPGRRIYLIDKPQRTQCQMVIGHLAPRYGTEDFLALMPVEAAFGGMFTSRLMQEIRVKRGWSYGAGCRMHRSRAPHWFRITMAPTSEVAVPALSLALELYQKLAEGGITGEELDLAIHHLTGGLPFSLATARQRMRLAVRHELLALDPGYARLLPEQLAALTPAAVRAASDRWLRPMDLCAVLVATADEVLPALNQAGLTPTEVIPWDSY